MPNDNTLPTPETRHEMFLAAAAGESVEKPEPITREEMFLNAIGGGGGSGDAYTKAQTDTLLAGKADLTDGKVPASELPSYVDDAVEGYYYNGNFYEDSEHTTVITGEVGKIYIDLTANKSYRWTGTVYTRIDECPAFGETQGTIYEGNKGKANADAIGTIANLTTTATNLVDAVNELNSGKVDKNGTDSLMTAAEHTKLSGIESGAEVNVQSDWNQTDDTADDFIKNKPNIPAGVVVDQSYSAVSTNAQSGVAVAQAVSGKANSADLATVATSGSYADLSNKPTIPDELADLQDDSTHRVVTDAEKAAWSGKQAALVVGTNLDNTPVQGSTNPITSGAIYTGLVGKVDTNGTDSLMTAAEHTKLSNCKTAWKGTQAAYDLLPDHTTYDLYFIEEASS